MILVVEDNPDLREIIAQVLSDHGCAVHCAASADEALHSLTSSAAHPEMILLDLIMPTVDGWEFLSELRKEHDFDDVPVVIMSGAGGVGQKAKQLGAAAVVRKPVEPATLLKLVDHFGRVPDSASPD